MEWRKAILSEEWLGYIGDVWTSRHLFKIKREDFVETGKTFCLESNLNEGCVCCYPTLEEAQSRAQEQWQELVQCGVELG